MDPGSTAHTWDELWSTTTPRSRSIAAVMRMWGAFGPGLSPSWMTRPPRSHRAAASRSALTIWLLAPASTRHSPPASPPPPATTNRSRPRPRAPTPRDNDRRPPPTLVGNLRAEPRHRLEELAHRACAGSRVAVEPDVAAGE